MKNVSNELQVEENAFCGFNASQKLESDSKDALQNNQTHRRYRRFLTDFFGIRYRLKKWNKNTITWR